MTKFDSKGLFLSFLSYPFYVDGKELYEKTLKIAFEKHRDNLNLFDPLHSMDDVLYRPAGYRMFGSQGLLIMSLVDDYMFFHRHFNKNHLQTLLKGTSEESVFDYNSVIISGVSENDGTTLDEKARNSFLLKEKRFPYVGVIRIKIDHRLLVGETNGIESVRKIKSQIDLLSDNHKKKYGCNTYHITVDCFNNDELTTIAFSDSLLYLYDFLGEVRGIKNTDSKIQQKFQYSTVTNEAMPCEKHMFGTTFITFGYNVDYCHSMSNPDFLQPSNNNMGDLEINCIVETKPGHCDAFFNYLEDLKPILGWKDARKNISGGCSIVVSLPLVKIHELEFFCMNDDTFCRDIRKIKISMKSTDGLSECNLLRDHFKSISPIDPIKIDYVLEVKATLKKIGVSKMVKDRILSLFDLYNRAYHNILQKFYLDDLRQALLNYNTMLTDMVGEGYSIDEIEEAVNKEITNMENACYDRLHSDKHNASPLEYSGGIQQYLTMFDYAYKLIYKTFSPNERECFYITISGAKAAASERTIFKLNINDIVFPELFITTAWKEVANFAMFLKKDFKSDHTSEGYANHMRRLMSGWSLYLNDCRSYDVIKYHLKQSDVFIDNDQTCDIVLDLISVELLSYFFKDFIVFHFVFQRDIKLMWHFYLKTLLQTTSVYRHINEIDNRQLIYMLLRLCMVGMISDLEDDKLFVEKQCSVPFDNIFARDWHECFAKVLGLTKCMYGIFEAWDFLSVNEAMIYLYEQNILQEDLDENKTTADVVLERLKNRECVINEMREAFNTGRLIQTKTSTEIDYVICLFYAYMKELYELDKPDSIIRSVPRDELGSVETSCFENNLTDKSSCFSQMAGVLSDVTGGFFIPSAKVRQSYFLLKTTLYRSLWNFRFVKSKF